MPRYHTGLDALDLAFGSLHALDGCLGVPVEWGAADGCQRFVVRVALVVVADDDESVRGCGARHSVESVRVVSDGVEDRVHLRLADAVLCGLGLRIVLKGGSGGFGFLHELLDGSTLLRGGFPRCRLLLLALALHFVPVALPSFDGFADLGEHRLDAAVSVSILCHQSGYFVWAKAAVLARGELDLPDAAMREHVASVLAPHVLPADPVSAGVFQKGVDDVVSVGRLRELDVGVPALKGCLASVGCAFVCVASADDLAGFVHHFPRGTVLSDGEFGLLRCRRRFSR